MTRLLISLVILTLGLVQCADREKKDKIKKYDKPNNPFLTTYSGGYTIEVEGLRNTRDIELYVLADNGKAQWMHLKTQGRKEPEIMTRKYGTWTATESYLKVTIDGNTGPLIEEYEMKAGIFYNKETPKR